MNELRYVLFALGLLFIIVGLSISIADNPAYVASIEPVYAGMVYLFYGFIGLMFIWVLITALTAFGQRKR